MEESAELLRMYKRQKQKQNKKTKKECIKEKKKHWKNLMIPSDQLHQFNGQ